METLNIYIDYTDENKNEYIVRYSDPLINKTDRFTEYSRESVDNLIKKTLKRRKIKNFEIFDTTNEG